MGADGFTNPVSTYQRKALAEWLTDVDHGAGPLAARVIVNRLWQHHFGEGLVRTPNDFGAQGQPPTHPELLDYLAGELIRGGWRLKPLHYLILTSAAYRQGSADDPARAALDPEDRLLWQRRPVRVEAEVLRDALLAVSGRLNPTPFGPPFRPRIPKEAMATRSKDPYPADVREGRPTWRRSIYAFVKRSVPYPLTEVFDAPAAIASCGRRHTSTVPTQALTLLNDELVRGCARQFAQRVIREAGPAAGDQVDRAFRLALGRAPTVRERARALAFMSPSGEARRNRESLTDLCHVLFTLNEFLYVD